MPRQRHNARAHLRRALGDVPLADLLPPTFARVQVEM